jgi:hypothetical protein
MIKNVMAYQSVKLWHELSQHGFKPVIPHSNHYFSQHETRQVLYLLSLGDYKSGGGLEFVRDPTNVFMRFSILYLHQQ